MAEHPGFKLNWLLTSTALVVSNDAPMMVKLAAKVAKAIYGNRIQVCDGVDDHVQIQAAIAALPAGGGKVVLTEGLFNISAPIIVRPIYFIIEGQGWVTTTLRLTNGANCNIFEDTGAGVTFLPTFKNLYLDGNNANNASGSGIDMASGFCYDMKVQDCAIYSFAESGIYIDGGWAHYISGCLFEFNVYALWLDTGSECRVLGNKFLSNNWDIKAVVLYDSIIADNIFGSAAVKSIWILTSPQGLKITGNSFHDCAYGIWLAPGSIANLTIANNSFADIPDRTAIRLNSPTDNITNSLITGNTFHSCADPIYNLKAIPSIIFSRQHSDLFMDVLAVDAAHVRSNEDLSEAIPNTFTLTAQPDVPRTLSGHFDAHAQITAYTIVITGVDAKGNTVTETFTEAASPWDFETVNAYATITSIIMTARTGTGAGDTMDIGVTDVLGLSNKIYVTSDVYKIKKNAANAVVAVAQVNVTYGTYDMSVIGLAATDDFTIWYKSNLNIVW